MSGLNLARAGALAKLTLGENLRAVRVSLGWTQDFLADHLDVGQAAVARWESGQTNMTVTQVAMAAAAYRVPFSRLVEGI
jgi:transcriptional regulator with XRE-family HTH domain